MSTLNELSIYRQKVGLLYFAPVRFATNTIVKYADTFYRTTNLIHALKLRLQHSYKRFVKTQICLTNPWIPLKLWAQILRFKRFVRIWIANPELSKGLIWINHESLRFSKTWNYFHKSNESSQIFSNICSRVSSLQILDSWARILANLDLRTCKSILSGPTLTKRFDSEEKFSKRFDLTRIRRKNQEVSIWLYLYTNLASLIKPQSNHSFSLHPVATSPKLHFFNFEMQKRMKKKFWSDFFLFCIFQAKPSDMAPRKAHQPYQIMAQYTSTCFQ